MDLDIENYDLDELLKVFDIQASNYNMNSLNDSLKQKLNILDINSDELPESKAAIRNFFLESYTKLIDGLPLNNKLVPPLGDTDVSSQSTKTGPHFVQVSNPQPVKYEKITDIKQGIVNPLSILTTQRILNINTKFRDNFSKSSSTDFVFTLPTELKRVTALSLDEFVFPFPRCPSNKVTVSSLLSSNNFSVSQYPYGAIPDLTNIKISEGTYNIPSLIANINTALATAGFPIILTHDTITNKMTFSSTDGSVFNLVFSYNETNNNCIVPPTNVDKLQLTLGWILGFRKEIYGQTEFVEGTSLDSYTGEATFNGTISNYYFLAVDDYRNNHNPIFISPFQNNSLSDDNLIAKLNPNEVYYNPHRWTRHYFGPVRLSKLHIRLYDEFGRILQIDGQDYSFTLKLQLLYESGPSGGGN